MADKNYVKWLSDLKLTLLPDEFTLEDYIKVRQAQGLDTSSTQRVKKALDQWENRGYIARLQDCDNGCDKNKKDGYGYRYSSIFRKLKFRTNS